MSAQKRRKADLGAVKGKLVGRMITDVEFVGGKYEESETLAVHLDNNEVLLVSSTKDLNTTWLRVLVLQTKEKWEERRKDMILEPGPEPEIDQAVVDQLKLELDAICSHVSEKYLNQPATPELTAHISTEMTKALLDHMPEYSAAVVRRAGMKVDDTVDDQTVMRFVASVSVTGDMKSVLDGNSALTLRIGVEPREGEDA